METRKSIGLKGYFTCTLLLFFVGVIAIFVLTLLTLFLSMKFGFIAPANAGEREARKEIDRQSEYSVFTNDLSPEYYNYIYFDKDGNVISSSLEGSDLSREIARFPSDNADFATGVYVSYEDGSRCFFTWRYMASFTNPVLRKILPNAEIIFLPLAGIASLLFFVLYVRGMGRKLGSKLSLVENASEQIAAQNLDTSIAASAGIKEFNHALQSMDNMRSILKDALIRQWESEQQRKQEIAALAHDIKTPLTIIKGNAELLLEDAMEEEQARLVNAIHSAGKRTQQYVSALQQISNLDAGNEEKKQVCVISLLDELNSILTLLASNKSISLHYEYTEDLRPIVVFPMMLVRALINIGENAIRFTEDGSHITISVCQNEQETQFGFQDQGPGFSQAALLHGKEMFWQHEESRTGCSNYGIGLSIADKVAKKHSGQLLLENTSQGGCVKLTITA